MRKLGLTRRLSEFIGGSYKNIGYILLVYFTVLLSMVFGQINNANLSMDLYDYTGDPVGAFGSGMNIWQTSLFYLVIIGLYVICIIIAKNAKILHANIKQFYIALPIFFVVFIYFLFLNLFSDFTQVFEASGVADTGQINYLMRVQGILDVSLSLLMCFAFFYLIPQTAPKDFHIKLIGYFVILFTLISTIYSLSTEIDVYAHKLTNFELIDKRGSEMAYSFFYFGNVYGHLHFLCIISLFLLSIVYKKRWIVAFGLIDVFFIYFSGCRGALLGAGFFYLFYAFYAAYIIYREGKHIVGAIIASITALVVIFLVLEATVLQNIQIENFHLGDMARAILHNLFSRRSETFEHLFTYGSNLNLTFGYGYNLNDFVDRAISGHYNTHNLFVEIYTTGGSFLCAVYLFGLVVMFYRAIVLIKHHEIEYASFYFICLLVLGLHGLLESYPPLFNYFGGGISAVYLILIPNIKYSEVKGVVFDVDYLFKPKDPERRRFLVDRTSETPAELKPVHEQSFDDNKKKKVTETH